MKALPREEVLIKPPKHKKHNRNKSTDPKVALHQARLKQITIRLNKYAKHDLSDKEILELLDDTRSQVLGLHLARKNKKKKKR